MVDVAPFPNSRFTQTVTEEQKLGLRLLGIPYFFGRDSFSPARNPAVATFPAILANSPPLIPLKFPLTNKKAPHS